MSEDEPLIQKLQQGSADAFAELIERHQRAIHGFLRARLLQPLDADDMTQEVFLRFYQARARFDSQQLVHPWLLGIARNLLREHLRSKKRRKETGWTELCLDLEAVLPPHWQQDDSSLEHLPECLDQLGPSARQALDLRYRQEMRLTEIGVELRRSEGAVKLLMHRARLALRDCLERKLRVNESRP